MGRVRGAVNARALSLARKAVDLCNCCMMYLYTSTRECERARDVARTVMYTYRPYMHPCVLPMHWQGQTSRECIVHSVSYAIRTMFSPLCLSKQCSAADVALAL